VQNKPSNSAISAGLLFSVFLWGANNAGIKFLVGFWPPMFVGSTRLIASGLVLFALFRWTNIFESQSRLSPELKRKLWWRGGLNLALYILAFNLALTMTSVSHVALYLGASPVWAVLWEGKPDKSWKTVQRYSAATLALVGVVVLFWPALKTGSTNLLGEILALGGSVLWTNYGRLCRAFTQELSGAEITAYTFWRAGVFLAPIAVFELAMKPIVWRMDLFLIQLFCIFASGVVAFALWNNALRHWKTSQVYLFTNLIPLSTMAWAHIFLGEQITRTFWFAMVLIVAGVLIGQTNWQKIFGKRWLPVE
jgi:drug/metabolite transporter (DMT)-like permease